VPLEVAYLVVCGARTAARAPDLVRGLLAVAPTVFTLLTENATRVIAPRELSIIDGNRVVESYFDAAILPRPPLGLVLVAPCTFNSLNKLAHGIADNLALSVVAEAIGRRTPVIVALSLNEPLLRHPQTSSSIAALRKWGVCVIEPVDYGDGPRLADDDSIMAEVKRLLEQA
jgi:phosphopantothenoylcysteine synthetase/decarboxylase